MSIAKIHSLFSGFTDAQRAIRLQIAGVSGIDSSSMLVKYASGVETICGGTEYVLHCVSLKSGLELKNFIANPVRLQFVTATGGLRTVCGIVAGIMEGGSDGGLTSYRLTVRDALSLLDKTCNTRVFRNSTEVEVTDVILSEWLKANPVLVGAFKYRMASLKDYPERETIMQYNESTAAFLRRLWRRRGIAWYIEADDTDTHGQEDVPSHTLVLFDNPYALRENPAGAMQFQRDHGSEQRDGVTAWFGERNLIAGKISRHSADYRKSWPMDSNEKTQSNQGVYGNAFAASLDDYLVDPPHAGDSTEDYRSLGILRTQRLDYEAKCFHGESGDREMRVGQWRRLDGQREIDRHPPNQREFICTELRVEAENNLPEALAENSGWLIGMNGWRSDRAAMLQSSAARDVRYTNRFTCVRRGVPILPAYDPRIDLPRTETQTAVVVGPANEEIFCDKLGRIKIRFPACRQADHVHARGVGAAGTDHDSAWVRVSSGWAGSRYGATSLPRVGDEVVVVFIGGDPDKPLVIGRVHGANTPPPSFSHSSELPGDRHLSGIVSREGQGIRYNQLRLDDTPGQISAQLASEHAHSQLNLGYLTHPRRQAKGDPRGEGAELRTDAALSVRGGQGVLISANSSPHAAGELLSSSGLAGLTEALSSVQKELIEHAGLHETDVLEDNSLTHLKTSINAWNEENSVTKKSPVGTDGGAIVAVDAPEGALFGSQKGVAIGAQTDVDLVSVRNTQISAGRKILFQALQGISLFSKYLGARLIAANGKVEIVAQNDDIEITSVKRIVISATDEIVLQSPKVTVISQGAQATFGGGAITQECMEKFTVKSENFESLCGGNGNAENIKMRTGSLQHSQRVMLVDMSSGEPFAWQKYRVTMEDGQVIEGVTCENGLTQEFHSSLPFGGYTIEAIENA